MKLFSLCIGFSIVFFVFGLTVYFKLIPPPEKTLSAPIASIMPSEIEGWKYVDRDFAQTEGSSDRKASFLNLDDSLCRIYIKDDVLVEVYIAYWSPGKVSYRWAGAHTPDTCWVANGWEMLERKYSIPMNTCSLKNAEFGIYKKDNRTENVYFWHLVGGQPFGYEQKEIPNIFGSIIDIKKYGLNLRQEQFFIRLSSSKNIEQLQEIDGFDSILDGLSKLNLKI